MYLEARMALTLGVKIGDVVDVANHWIALLSTDSRRSATLINDEGRKFEISAREMAEVMPDVWIGLGRDRANSKLRLIFDAPREISITRREG
jgi:hypothetical protein